MKHRSAANLRGTCLLAVLAVAAPIGAARAQVAPGTDEFPSLIATQGQSCDPALIRLVLKSMQRPVTPPRNTTGYAPVAKDVQAAACKQNPAITTKPSLP